MKRAAFVIIAIIVLAAWVFYPAVGTVVAIEDDITLVEFQGGNVYGFYGNNYDIGNSVCCIMAFADRTTVTDDMVVWVFELPA